MRNYNDGSREDDYEIKVLAYRTFSGRMVDCMLAFCVILKSLWNIA